MSLPQNSQNLQLDTQRHSMAHLMAAAVGQMFPEVQFGVGPVIENGCYYDFILPRTLIPEDLPLIEAKMKEMLKQHLSYKVQEVSIEEAILLFEKNNQPLKVELLNDLRTKGTTSLSEEEKRDFEEEIPLLRGTDKVGGVDNLPSWKQKSLFPFWELPKNKDLESMDKELRKAGVLSETLFWQAFNNKEILGFDLDRQVIIGDYVVDFMIAELGLVVEIDGETHDFKGVHGEKRESYLSSLGLEVVHYQDLEVKKSINFVADSFQAQVKKRVEFLNKSTPTAIAATPQEGNSTTAVTSEIENPEDFGGFPKITIYRIVNETTGEILFEDLCKGPHVDHVKELKGLGFALDKFSAAYWRGDQERDIRMQRLYALVFETVAELSEVQTQREEAKKRDHRLLNETQKYYTISDLVGSGLPLFQPKGNTIRKLIQNYLWQMHKNKGYLEVWTPHIAKEALYQTSGHAKHYLDDMFSVYGGTSKENFYLKPMNCPHHMQLFADNMFSYRDMPIRYFEHATVYRDEKTGQLSGLTRVRNITQDDGHLFCRLNQLDTEVGTIVEIIKEFMATFGMSPKWVSLSIRDSSDGWLGTDDMWKTAEDALREAAIKHNIPYKIVEGEAAFYGPKLDFMFTDTIGRQQQLSTVQIDFNLPERFDLSFVNEEGENERPVVVHRAIAGSAERFMGVMIEQFAGRFPFWLASTQVKVLTINTQPEILEYVEKVKEVLNQTVLMKPLKYNEVRYEVDDRSESLGKKIREAEMEKVPVIIIVGPKDIAEGQVSVRTQEGESKVKLNELMGYLEGLN